MVLTITMLNEPGVTSRMKWIIAHMIFVNYEGIHEPDMRYEIWSEIIRDPEMDDG